MGENRFKSASQLLQEKCGPARDFGQNANGTVEQLEETLRDVGDAAQAIRDLAETLERDPDMLLKGRSPKVKP